MLSRGRGTSGSRQGYKDVCNVCGISNVERVVKYAFNIADASSIQDACHNETSKYDLVRAFNGVTEGHGFDSCRGLRFFSFSYVLDNLNIPSFLEKKNSANRKYRSIDKLLVCGCSTQVPYPEVNVTSLTHKHSSEIRFLVVWKGNL